jgi:amino-acid N-acetyltransferase
VELRDISITADANAGDLAPLLTASGLGPWLRGGDDAEALVARRRDGGIVGCAVLLLCGDVGLLRSVAVAEEARGAGLGRALVNELVDRPLVRRLSAIYLLTTTVPGFFRRLGFETVERDHVDPAIKRTAQYRSECPETAVVMRRLQTPGDPRSQRD